MRDWKQVRIDAAIDVFFCDPHAVWQRGSDEDTNGLLRQYFPKGPDFATVTADGPDTIADSSTTDPANASPTRTHRADLRATVAMTARYPHVPCGTLANEQDGWSGRVVVSATEIM